MGLFGDIFKKKPAEDPQTIWRHAMIAEMAGLHDEALFLYQKAAKMGHSESLCCIGLMYLDGRGFSKDIQKAKNILNDAATQGSSRAKRTLSEIDEGLYD